MNIKRITAFLLIIVLIFSLAGCEFKQHKETQLGKILTDEELERLEQQKEDELSKEQSEEKKGVEEALEEKKQDETAEAKQDKSQTNEQKTSKETSIEKPKETTTSQKETTQKPKETATEKPKETTVKEPVQKPYVVSVQTESKKEDSDYVEYSSKTIEDSSKEKGTSGVKTKGKNGYTTFTYERKKTTYSDGSVKYTKWEVVSSKKTAPVTEVKWIGTKVVSEKVSAPSYYDESVQKEMLAAINAERQKAGVPLLTLDTELAQVAQIKAEDLVINEYFDHVSPIYGSPFDMMKYYGIRYSYAGENIAYGYRTIAGVMQGWMESPGHKKNILNAEFRYVGFGLYENHWVQMFINK